MSESHVLVGFTPKPEERESLHEVLGDIARITYINDLPDDARAEALKSADVFFGRRMAAELRPGEIELLADVKMIQEHGAGVDFMPFARLSPTAVIASNAGSTAEPIAEHTVALIMALAKRIVPNHNALSRGDFPQGQLNKSLRDSTCAIIGFGGIGQATARLLRPFGTKIYALNRTGKTDEPVDFIGTLDNLEHAVRNSDIVVISIPNNNATRGMFNAERLSWLKPDAILVSIARAAHVEETPLWEHMQTHPDFQVAIDAWWVEPMRHGEFKIQHPFFDSPNFLGSPHNSSAVPGLARHSSRKAAQNIRRFLQGEPVNGQVRREDYLS
ncbi:MAG: 2-hydroxyacid dehydrogenase [Chloroflexota bacterium]